MSRILALPMADVRTGMYNERLSEDEERIRPISLFQGSKAYSSTLGRNQGQAFGIP
jgi:hypothetical protein